MNHDEEEKRYILSNDNQVSSRDSVITSPPIYTSPYNYCLPFCDDADICCFHMYILINAVTSILITKLPKLLTFFFFFLLQLDKNTSDESSAENNRSNLPLTSFNYINSIVGSGIIGRYILSVQVNAVSGF